MTDPEPRSVPMGRPRESKGDEGSATGDYLVIARRYRPRFFREVVGQESIAESLRQGILQSRLAHAYLFCGPRGVGKTSMARIFARALQCPERLEGDPCDRCATCDRILRGEDMDVHELDAASHRGIDDVREIIQHVRFKPASGPYRVFIIDEVHMLTKEAFNALLKTLEEPPPHAKFILCTTEPEKLPATVVSRCQRCDFAPISERHLVERLEQICSAENATPESGLLERVARLSRGGMRDSQSLLDQLLTLSGGKPTVADVEKISGRLSPPEIARLVDTVERGERAAIICQLAECGTRGADPGWVLEQVIEELRERLHRGAREGWGHEEIDRSLLAQEILQEARIRARQTGHADWVLELALLRIATLRDTLAVGAIRDALREVPRSTVAVSPPAVSPAAVSPAPRPIPQIDARAASSAAMGSGSVDPASTAGIPERIRAVLERVSPLLARSVGEKFRLQGDTFELLLEPSSPFRQLDLEKREALRRELQVEFGRTLRVELGATPVDTPGAGPAGRAPEPAKGPARVGTDGGAPPPSIVEKAKDLFHGSYYRPPRR